MAGQQPLVSADNRYFSGIFDLTQLYLRFVLRENRQVGGESHLKQQLQQAHQSN